MYLKKYNYTDLHRNGESCLHSRCSGQYKEIMKQHLWKHSCDLNCNYGFRPNYKSWKSQSILVFRSIAMSHKETHERHLGLR